jgi:hypothetical protein
MTDSFQLVLVTLSPNYDLNRRGRFSESRDLLMNANCNFTGSWDIPKRAGSDKILQSLFLQIQEVLIASGRPLLSKPQKSHLYATH